MINVKIKKAVDEFNRYKSKEANARLIYANKDILKMMFKGSFCHTCGFYDYFDDLKILLENNGLLSNILNIKEIDEGAIVDFKINSYN